MSKINTITVGGTPYDVEDTSKVLQVSTMPTASAETVGKIVQFIGTTGNGYTNGYFYVCVSDGEQTPTYSWEQVNVQPDLPSDSYMSYVNEGENTSSNIFVFENKKKGIYFINNTYNNKMFYYKVKESDSNTAQYSGQPLCVYLLEDFDYDNAETNHVFGYLICIFEDQVMQLTKIRKGSSLISGGTQMYILLSGSNQSIFGVKTFYSIPKQNNTTAPTQDAEFTNKKYVDDQDRILLNNLAPTYDATLTYDVGDYVIYNKLLYVCNTAITVAEAWTAAHWTQTTVAEIIKSLSVVTLSSQDQSNLQSITGSSSTVVSDMTEAEAIEATNEIIGGNE